MVRGACPRGVPASFWVCRFSFLAARLPSKIAVLNCERSIAGWPVFCAVVVAVSTSGCGVALAPAYKIVRETRTVQFVPGSPSALQIGLHYELKNSGTTPLPFLDLRFPGAKAFGTEDMRAAWGGQAVELHELPEEYRPDHPNTLRVHFEPPWARGRGHQLDVHYTFRSPGDFGAHITLGEDAFHLAARGWSALPQRPPHFLSPYPVRPPKMTYAVRLPAGYRVLARGKLKHRKTRQNETEYQFELGKNDLAPFLVAGRYMETPFGPSSARVIFWTLHALHENPGLAAQRIANAWATLQTDFGPIDTEAPVPHIVEAPGLRSRSSGGTGPAVASFPGGALVNDQALALGIASDAFIERVSHALARNWFGDQMYASPDAQIGVDEGLPEYATIVIDEAGGGPAARRRRIEEFLDRYIDASQRAREKPLGVTLPTDSPAQRTIALAKAPLMYVALEDLCGEGPVRRALRQLVTLLRGQEVGFDDLRSAMEQTCGKDLGEFFRAWLYQKGLPPDFARRYESGALSASGAHHRVASP